MAGTIAVTGASGQVGGLVAARLAGTGTGQRLVVRDRRRAPELAGADVAEATYGDGEALRRALDGAATLFLVSASEAPDRVRLHTSVVDAAVAAGVERVVYLSFLRAAADATFTFARDHWHTEQHIRATGLRFTFLRDNLYLSMLPAFVGPDGVMRGPAGDGRVAAVAPEDVADVALAVLLGGDRYDGRTEDVTGPEAISLAEAADQIGRAAGRPVTYEPETLDEAYASRAGLGAPAYAVDGWVTSYVAIATGELAAVTDTVPRLTGHPAMDLATYLRGHPERYAHLRRV